MTMPYVKTVDIEISCNRGYFTRISDHGIFPAILPGLDAVLCVDDTAATTDTGTTKYLEFDQMDMDRMSVNGEVPQVPLLTSVSIIEWIHISDDRFRPESNSRNTSCIYSTKYSRLGVQMVKRLDVHYHQHPDTHQRQV